MVVKTPFDKGGNGRNVDSGGQVAGEVSFVSAELEVAVEEERGNSGAVAGWKLGGCEIT